MEEKKIRSLVKSISWRIIVLFNSIIVMFFFVHDVSKSIMYSVIINSISTVLYYIHERIWNKLKWKRS